MFDFQLKKSNAWRFAVNRETRTWWGNTHRVSPLPEPSPEPDKMDPVTEDTPPLPSQSPSLSTITARSISAKVDTPQKKIWKEAFKGFYQQHSRGLWFYIYKTCGDKHLADDLYQESFYRFLRAEPLQLNEYQQRAYLYRIATNLIIDGRRKTLKEQTYKSEAGPERFNAVVECGQEREFLSMDMEKLFSLLKTKERTLLWLAYIEGYDHKEIANITGLSETGIKVKLFRTRKKFASILEKKGYFSGLGRKAQDEG